MTLFQTWERAETRQVIDTFQNHFLKSVFKIVAGKNLPKAIDAHVHHENRRNALRAALDVFKEVREKGLEDNPEDKVIISREANISIDRAIESFERLPADEQDTKEIMTSLYANAKMAISSP
ncbi:MAG: hypothetical protein AAF988_00535 [Pseudomonadota bacterium]